MTQPSQEVSQSFMSYEEAVQEWLRAAGKVERVRVQVAPGVLQEVLLPAEKPPRFLLSHLVYSHKLGRYVARPLVWPCLVKLHTSGGKNPDNMRSLLGLSSRTVQRLIEAGFVRGCRPAPACVLVDLESLMEHLGRCMGPAGMCYWTPDRAQRYSEAVNGTRAERLAYYNGDDAPPTL